MVVKPRLSTLIPSKLNDPIATVLQRRFVGLLPCRCLHLSHNSVNYEKDNRKWNLFDADGSGCLAMHSIIGV